MKIRLHICEAFLDHWEKTLYKCIIIIIIIIIIIKVKRVTFLTGFAWEKGQMTCLHNENLQCALSRQTTENSSCSVMQRIPVYTRKIQF